MFEGQGHDPLLGREGGGTSSSTYSPGQTTAKDKGAGSA